MFMRYLWLSLFVDSGGRIPIFIELRNLNKITQADISPYLFHTLTRGKSKLSIQSFRRGLEKGEFVVILDGYDELTESIKDKVQQAVLELTEDYPLTSVIVSSRPDQQFASWQNFDVAEVAPLTRLDTVELIQKVDFDNTIKSKFIDKIKEDAFYSSNSSFLSNPLLASMMLLAFSQNYEIPDKMHQFYELAYDALYKRHDRYKPGGFKRQFQSTKDEDEFKRVFSYFCLLTFYEQKFAFSSSTAEKYIRSAIELNQSKFGTSPYIDDLCSAVCIMIKEGNDYVFPHRSFQEYFAAYCLAFVTKKNFKNIVTELVKRPHEQAVIMLRDMNPELLRDEFVVPMAVKYQSVLKNVANKKNIAAFMEVADIRFEIAYVSIAGKKDRTLHILLHEGGELEYVAKAFERLSGKDAKGRSVSPRGTRDNLESVVSDVYSGMRLANADRIVFSAKESTLRVDLIRAKGGKVVNFSDLMKENLIDAMTDSFLYGYVGGIMKNAASYANKELAIATQNTVKMASIFGVE